MTEIERRAIVWDLIEQSAFWPREKVNSWLKTYSKQLRKLLQLEPIWFKDSSPTIFQVAELQIACTYTAEGQNNYVASLEKMDDERVIWSVHVDERYLSKSALHRAAVCYPKSAINAHLRPDIEHVLDGMLFHPRNHTHLSNLGVTTAGDVEPSCGMLKADDIRVIGSAYNCFVFLYHLAYQLCVVSKEARDKEKSRLIDIFEDAIKNNHPPSINARDLFKF